MLKGSVARHIDKDGYNCVRIYRRMYGVHRLAWLYVHGILPEMVDHIDGSRSNNVLSNLRPCNKSQNAMNSKVRKDNSTGIRGVYFCKYKGRYKADVHISGRRISLGYHDTAEAAGKAYKEAAVRLHGEFVKAD
jgi:hypothetical protein